LNITVVSFTPYCVFNTNQILLVIQPQLAVVKTGLKAQYFILVDTVDLTAKEV